MNKKSLLKHIMILTLGITSIFINLPKSLAFQFYEEELDLKVRGSIVISASTGYRTDNLDWNFAGDQYGQNPNILSELEFNDMEIYQAGLDVKATFNRIYSRISVHFGEIMDGQVTDSDYDEDNRSGLWCRSESQTDDDNVQDIYAGMGYRFDFIKKKLRIAPLIGVSHHEQNIRLTDLVQTVSTPAITFDLGPIPGLDSTYETEWKTWWLGMDIAFNIAPDLYLSSSLEYHFSDYEAKADWNLNENFAHPVSFIHDADGEGIVVKIGIMHAFAITKAKKKPIKAGDKKKGSEKKRALKPWNIGLIYSWGEWSASEGLDRVFLATGGTITTRLNEVNWDSQSINLLLSYKF